VEGKLYSENYWTSSFSVNLQYLHPPSFPGGCVQYAEDMGSSQLFENRNSDKHHLNSSSSTGELTCLGCCGLMLNEL